MLLRKKPFPIIKIGEYVYKFLPPDLLEIETSFFDLKDKIAIYNEKTAFAKFIIPQIDKFKFFTKTTFLGETLFESRENIDLLFKSISYFSELLKKEDGTTVCIGDIQLRNVYFKNEYFYLLDLGISADKKVPMFYNESRFLVHLVDSGFSNKVSSILKSSINKEEILLLMNRRYIKVVKKRLFAKKYFSCFYRALSYLKFLLQL